jgi:uncharacterized 2Fe-2S/4Fe-4S cluster protein (DUF4445 family)
MVQVFFQPANRRIAVPEGLTILEAARRAKVIIEAPCNGNGTCGKCKVKLGPVLQGMNNVDTGLASSEGDRELVLACQTIINSDVRVEIPGHPANEQLKILMHGQNLALEQKVLISKKYDPATNLTRIYADQEILGVEPGNTEAETYGVVVDIGTTTLVISIVDLRTGEERGLNATLNPQAIHAHDVLSRIQFAATELGLTAMYSELIAALNRMITEVTGNLGIHKEHIYEVIFSGNTCMLHLALNVNPVSLGKYPYTPAVKGGTQIQSLEHNLDISKYGVIYLPPVISAYVGADITSGILAVKLHEQNEPTLLVDIGTNGEMALSCNNKLVSTSTAAGPAFEGMNITFGMRAAQGAIEHFDIEADGRVGVKTIGNVEAKGICGSGLLDIIGQLAAHGVIDKSGRFLNPGTPGLPVLLQERLAVLEGKTVFMITEKIWLTQKDVRQVQLAKAAIRAGIEFLLNQAVVKAEEICKVLIAGSFGYHVRIASLFQIGLLPAQFQGKVEAVGNTSLTGGQAFLLNTRYRREMSDLVRRVEVIELANYPDFDRVFVNQMGFSNN